MDDSESEKIKSDDSSPSLETLLSSILDAVPDAVLGIREPVIVFANPAVEDVFGWRSDELIGQSTRVLYRSDEEYEEIGRQFYPKLEERRTFAAQFPCRHRNGKDMVCQIRVSRIGDDLREKMVVATYQDITERLETECQLNRVNETLDLQVRDREEKFRAIFTQALNLLGLVDLKGRQVEVNDASAAFVGVEQSKLVGNLFWENPWWGHSDKEQQAIRESVERSAKGEISAFETTCRDYAGKIHHIDYSLKPIRDDQGRVKILLAEGRDITDRKEMEEIVRESENNYRTIFEAVNDGIFIHDLKTGEVLDANLKGVDIFGYRSKAEIRGLTLRDFCSDKPPYTVEKALDYIQKASAEGPQIFIWPGKKKDGELVWMEVSLKRASLRKRDCIIAVVRDISERKREEEEKKRLEVQIQQALKMEAIGTLAGGIAHDFNNLLMGIQGNTSLMLLRADPGKPCYDRLKAIEQQVMSGADLTKQLLGFARRGRYEVKTTDLNDLVQMTAALFGRTKKEIRIQGKYEEGLWTVEVDQGQIEQALLNLFVNAWQAMPGGGTLYLETRNVVLDENYVKPYEIKIGPYAKLSVTDTGVGMDEKTRLRIFEPFYTTKEMKRGTGLGLASTYGIVKGHGGIINVYSESGHGTTFNIYLPVSEKGIAFTDQPPAEIKTGQETILLVDDENIIVEVTQEILEELGYHVLIARDGEAAVEIYQEHKDKIDLVILDMIMPGMGGGAVYDCLKEINPDVPVILSSGYSINGEAMEIMERGVRAFLQKPFTVMDLSARVCEVLDKKRA